MTSKNSFLASLKENNKRRIWLWCVSVFGFVLLLPMATAMLISRTIQNSEYLFDSFGEVAGRQMLQERLFEQAKGMLGTSGVAMWVLIAALAVASAIQGYAYLFNRKKIDFYMGMPVKRRKRFLVIWLNGILVYLLPYLIGLLISSLILLSQGAMNGEVLKEIVMAYGLYFGYYLGIYHLTILAVMLTGHVMINCLGVAVFFLYELVV